MEIRHAARLAVEAIEAGETFDYLENVVCPALMAALKESQPLSDERLMDLVKESHAEYWGSNAHFRKFARAVEKEHGVK